MGKMILGEKPESITAENMPGMAYMERANERDRVAGTSRIMVIMSISIEPYAKKPYTINSIME